MKDKEMLKLFQPNQEGNPRKKSDVCSDLGKWIKQRCFWPEDVALALETRYNG